jgi:flagellar L-ring protein precursor FlgH
MNFFKSLVFFILVSCAATENNNIHNSFKSMQPDYTNILNEKSLDGTIYEGSGGLFASDRRANKVGDIITITLDETVTANNNGSATLNKSQDYTFDLPDALFGPSSLLGKLFFNGGIKEANLSTANNAENMTATGTTKSDFTMDGTVSVTVVRVFPNGNLEIKGSRKVSFKSGNEYVSVQGVIRPEDISASNTVSSLKIADAQIAVSGDGSVTNVTTKGWLSKFFSYAQPF